MIPVEVSGAIGVTDDVRPTSDGRRRTDPDDFLKAFYSSVGVGVTQVAAPGGDSV